MLFEVAIIEVPTPDQFKAGASEKLVFGPTCVIAKDAQAAGIKAVMGPDKPVDPIDMDRAQVLIRPFA